MAEAVVDERREDADVSGATIPDCARVLAVPLKKQLE
jgi:hypothetical protein